jgi:zinc protease
VPRSTPDYHALLLLNMVLGGQFISRINMNLREDKGFTYGARTSFDFRRGLGPFQLQVSVHTAATAEAIRESLAEVRAIRVDRPPSGRELEQARAALTRGYPRNFETADQIARSSAQLALYGLPDDYFERFVPAVHALTVDDLTAVAQRHIDPSASRPSSSEIRPRSRARWRRSGWATRRHSHRRPPSPDRPTAPSTDAGCGCRMLGGG